MFDMNYSHRKIGLSLSASAVYESLKELKVQCDLYSGSRYSTLNMFFFKFILSSIDKYRLGQTKINGWVPKSTKQLTIMEVLVLLYSIAKTAYTWFK